MKKAIKNILSGIGGHLIIMAFGIIIPKFILISYGDETNGLISAIGQLFTYLALIEAGVGQSALQALYKPLVEKDHERVSGIIGATRDTFARLTRIYCLVVIAFAAIYPAVIQINEPDKISFIGSTYFAVFMLILCQGLSNAVGFYYSSTLKQLLVADGYNYIIVNITTVIRLSTSILRILLINMRVNVVVLQMIYIGMAAAEAIIYRLIIQKKYPWLQKNAALDKSALSQRSAFLVHETANVIFSSTDILVLSVFCDLNAASIYSVYNLVFAALSTIISQVHSGCFYILGQTYHKSKNWYQKIHDAYDTYYMAFVFTLISAAYVLILPFIRLYTAGISDLPYVDGKLAMLFAMIQLLSCCRITSSNLIKIAGYAKATTGRAIAESIINLLASLIFVKLFGIYGVLMGTIAALLYRTNDMILYANRRILKRTAKRTYAAILINYGLFILTAYALSAVSMDFISNYAVFFAAALVVTACMFVVFFGVNALMFRNSYKCLIEAFRGKTEEL